MERQPRALVFSGAACPLAALIVAAACFTGLARADTLVERENRGLVEVITSGGDFTSVQIAQDLADVLDDGATRRILPVVGRGSTQNLLDLKALRGVDVGIVPTDVLEAARKQKSVPGLETSITYIAKLYNEELHVLAPASIHELSELDGKRVNFASTAAITGPAIFDLLKIKVEANSDDPMTALQKLKSGELAALVYVAAKPSALSATLNGEDGTHFLAVPLRPELASSYVPAQLTAEDYPSLIGANAPVETIAVGAAMVVAGLQPNTERYRNVARFVDAFFTQFQRLQEAPHLAKWQDVNLAAELPGWKRFPPADDWLKRNAIASAAPPSEQELRDIFSKFLDERARLSGGKSMSTAEKKDMFDQFQRWQKGAAR
ncbi:MAG: TRAP transporter substrate-binding protein [Alphaproteobacteria bacterium]|nr:TRAP transporter substrate-binding protein [Alphaproteobacteria bacterium]